MAVIEVRFRAGRLYAGLQELLEALGVADCLSSDTQTYGEVIADGNIVRFAHSSGARRAIVLKQLSFAANEFALLIPNNTLLYGRIYSQLNKKKLVFTQKMADESAYGLDYKTAGLLKPF